MKGLIRTIVAIWRLSAPYFQSKDKWIGRLLLLLIVAASFASVAVAVRMNVWQRDFFNALQAYDRSAWASQILVFFGVVIAQVVIGVALIWLMQLLEIRWRRFMTAAYLERWLERNAHYRMQLRAGGVDNPDQRISQDVPLFIERTMAFFVGDRGGGGGAAMGGGAGGMGMGGGGGSGLLTAATTLAAFWFILWGLSSKMPLPIGGQMVIIPGFLAWAALIYATISTLVTHWVGRRLIGLRFEQQRYEADFRFELVRVREHSEQIALLSGEPVERRRLMDRFGEVVRNWHRLMQRQLKLGVVTMGLGVSSAIVPSLLLAPAFFERAIGFGEYMQVLSAFITVQQSLNFFVIQYRNLAEWKAIIDRLTGFEDAAAAAQAESSTAPLLNRPTSAGKCMEIKGLTLSLPNGAPLMGADSLRLSPGDRVLVNGPTGSGKSTTLRAIGGIWPCGDGEVRIPEGAAVMIAPQRPYLPSGSLAAAVCFPAAPEAWPRQALEEVLSDVGLGRFADRLDETDQWDRRLSPGEQQRIALARVLLHQPDFLFLDEATASLDEASEAEIYQLIRTRLPKAAIVSIGHRSTLAAFHDRRLKVLRKGDRNRLAEDKSLRAVPATGGAV